MNNSITDFFTNGIAKLGKITEKFYENPEDFFSFIKGLREITSKFELDYIKEVLEDADQKLRESPGRKEKYSIVKTDGRSLVTSLGVVNYKRTYFREKDNGAGTYLVDEAIGLNRKEHVTEDAKVKVLSEVTESSYRKTGEETCINEDLVSKQTVLNILHSLEFPKEKPAEEKKKVRVLYIDADEDHVALQYINRKGDVERSDGKYKNNGMLVKLVYVYEGIEKERPAGKRRRLINPHYFSGAYAGEENGKLWDELKAYIEGHYDTEYLKRVYLNADGGGWIRAGREKIPHAVSVLDEFHLSKYLVSMTHFLWGDTGEIVRDELREKIQNDDMDGFIELCGNISSYAADESTEKRIEKGRAFICANWDQAVYRLSDRKNMAGCSAEGHVSHLLSARMSSRPMGWSRKGADRLAHLIAYKKNGGDLLELVRYQDGEEETAQAAGAEEMKGLSLREIMKSERSSFGINGKYVEKMQATLAYQSRKMMSIGMGMWL